MDIHQLKLFLAVMESRNMTHAAQQFHLSPGAVSLQLHSLSDELHAELFVRSGKATRLAEHAKEVIRWTSQIQQEFADDVSKDVRPFQFATGVTTLIHQLPRPLRELRKRFPNADIGVTVGVTEEIVAGLHERRFDLGLISLPVSEENLKILPLFDEELLVLRPSQNSVRSTRIGVIQTSDIAQVPFLLYPKRSNIRTIIDQFFQEINISPRVVMEAEDSEAIKGLVESGFGYSILPQHALRRQNRFFHTYRVAGHRLTRSLALAMVRTDYPRKLTESVAEFLQKILTTQQQAAASSPRNFRPSS
jgi:DNA-binding transcriptional LysR family regulator